MAKALVHTVWMLLAVSAVHGQTCENNDLTEYVSFIVAFTIIITSLSCCSVPTVCSSMMQSSLEGCSAYYSQSSFPNNLTRTILEASTAYEIYRGFYTTYDCSAFAEVFICLALAPQCEAGRNVARPPCASFCDRVKADCNDAILFRGGFGFDVYCLLTCSR